MTNGAFSLNWVVLAWLPSVFRCILTVTTMATPRKNQSKKPPESPPDRMQRTAASRFLGVSLATVKRWEGEGKLVPTVDEQGQHWFELAHLEKVKAENQGMTVHEPEVLVSTVDAATGQAKDAGRHTEKILGLVLNPSYDLLQLYKDTCADLRAELTKVREENFSMLTKMSEILKAQRQEDIEAERLKLSDMRKQQAFGLIKSAVPLLLAQASGNKQLGQLLNFVQGLEPEQLRILIDSGLLTAQQIEALKLALTESQLDGLAKPENTSGPETPPESTADAP